MPSTSGDFWRMLAEQNVEVVLVLQSPDLQDPVSSRVKEFWKNIVVYDNCADWGPFRLTASWYQKAKDSEM